MDNYEYKIMQFICSSESTDVRMSDVVVKFGKAGRESAVMLCKNNFLTWAYAEDDAFQHDEYGIIKPTSKGLLEYERFKYNRQLKTGEVWHERIISYIIGVLTPVTAYLITEFVIPLLRK